MSKVNLKVFKQTLNYNIQKSQEVLRQIEELEKIEGDYRVNKLLNIAANIQPLSDGSGIEVLKFRDQYGELIYSSTQHVKEAPANEEE